MGDDHADTESSPASKLFAMLTSSGQVIKSVATEATTIIIAYNSNYQNPHIVTVQEEHNHQHQHQQQAKNGLHSDLFQNNYQTYNSFSGNQTASYMLLLNTSSDNNYNYNYNYGDEIDANSTLGSGYNHDNDNNSNNDRVASDLSAVSGGQASTWSLLMSALFEYSNKTDNNTEATIIDINWSILILATILIILMLTTAVGNLFVIVAILIERNLRTIGNYLVLSLAIADLLVACLVMPLASIYQILDQWTLGVLLCDIWTSADVFCCTASILHLLAIALDRYWAVTRVDYIRCQRNEKRILFMIFFVWMAASIISLAPVFGWKDDLYEWRITNDKECLISQDIGYQIFATCTTFYFPLILTLIFYWKIYQVARKRIRKKLGNRVKVALQQPSSTSSGSTGQVAAQTKQQPPARSQLQSNIKHQSGLVNYVLASSKLGSAKSASSIYYQQKQPGRYQDERLGHFDREKYYYSSMDNEKASMVENCSCSCHSKPAMTRTDSTGHKLGAGKESLPLDAKLDAGLVKLDEDNQSKSECQAVRCQSVRKAEQGNSGDLGQAEVKNARALSGGSSGNLAARSNSKSASVDNCPAASYCLKCKRINQMLCQQQQKQHGSGGIAVNEQEVAGRRPSRADKLVKSAAGCMARAVRDHDTSGKSHHRSSTTSDILYSSMASCSRASSLALDMDNQHDDPMVSSSANFVSASGAPAGHKSSRKINSSSLTASCNEISQQSGRTDSTYCTRDERPREDTGGDKAGPAPTLAKQGPACQQSVCSEANYINQDDRRSSAMCDCCACNCCDMNLNYYEEGAGAEEEEHPKDRERPAGGGIRETKSDNGANQNDLDNDSGGQVMELDGAKKRNQAEERESARYGQQNGGINCLDGGQNGAQTNNQQQELATQRVTIDRKGVIASDIVVAGRQQARGPPLHQDSFDSDAIVKEANETYKRIVANNTGAYCKGPANGGGHGGGGGGQAHRSPRLVAICWRRLMALQRHTRLFRRQGSLQPTIESSETRCEADAGELEPNSSTRLVLCCKLCHCPVADSADSAFGQRQVPLRPDCKQPGKDSCDIEANELAGTVDTDADGDVDDVDVDVDVDDDDGAGGAKGDPIVASNFANLSPNNRDSLLIAVASTASIIVSTTVREAASAAIRPVTKTTTTTTTTARATATPSPVKGSNQQHQSNVGLQNHATNMEGVESKRERKAAKTLAIITGVFVMCWLPFFVMAILMPLLQLKPHKFLFAFLLWLGYVNSMLNPIIYTIFSPDFRKAFKRLLCAIDDNSPTGRRNNKGRASRGAKFTSGGNRANWNGGQNRSNAVVRNFS